MEQPKTLTIDLETNSLDPFHNQIILIGYRYDASGPVRVIHVYDGEIPDEQFREALKCSYVTKRGHNVNFDLLTLASKGYDIAGPVDDTRILAYLQDPQQDLDLKGLVERKLKRKVVRMEDFGRNRIKKDLPQKHPTFYGKIIKSGKYWVSKKTLERYNVADVINCDDLKQELPTTNWYRQIEQPLSGILLQTEIRGIQLDIPYLKGLENEFKTRLEEISKELGTDFNPASPKQVKEKFKEKGVDLETTDKYQLKQLAWKGDKFANQLLEFRGYSKLLGTYIHPFIEQADSKGRIHGRFNQAGRESASLGDIKGTATGRLSSSDPNLQNIPDRTEEGRKVRRGIIATPGMILIDSDLKQIEPRLIAHYSQSKVLLNAYEKNLDTHAIMGGLIFNKNPESLTKMERFIGKTSWLATVYGCWYKKLRQIVELNSDEMIYYDDEFYKKIQETFWKANPDILAWRNKVMAETRNQAGITTFGGRTIRIQGLHEKQEWLRNQAERMAINYLIQGSAADIMKMISVEMAKEKEIHSLAWCHDEILAEYLPNYGFKEKIHCAMINTVKLKNVPIDADTKEIRSWAEK